MITIKEEYDQFVRECKSYKFIQKKILYYKDKLSEIDYKLRKNDNLNISELLKQEEETKEKIRNLEFRLAIVDNLLNKLSAYDRSMITDLYINGKKHEGVAQKHYMSRQNMYNYIYKVYVKTVD